MSTLANSFGTILRFSSEPIESVDITKRKLLYKIILFINLFGIPAVAFAVIESIFLKQYIIAFSYIVFYSPILIVTIIQKKLSYNILVFVPIIITYLLGTVNLVIWGFSGAGVPLLLTLLVLATVFYNMKVGMITLVINLFTIITVGMLYLYNVLTLSVKLQEIMHQPLSWITAWSILTLIGLLVVISYGIIHNQMVVNLQYSERLRSTLKLLNKRLRDDVDRRKRTERQLTVSLKDKEVMLAEVHHRVKNNLQQICSILNLQEYYFEDAHDRDLLKNCIMRIRAMDLIQEKIYSSEKFSEIFFSDFIKELITDILSFYHMSHERVVIDFQSDQILLDINLALPCGQILSELITNTMKHAFPNNTKGSITINFRQSDKNYILTFGDNGVGFPKNFRFPGTDTLGLLIVETLVQQLNGTIEIINERGLAYTIVFPVKHQFRSYNRVI